MKTFVLPASHRLIRLMRRWTWHPETMKRCAQEARAERRPVGYALHSRVLGLASLILVLLVFLLLHCLGLRLPGRGSRIRLEPLEAVAGAVVVGPHGAQHQADVLLEAGVLGLQEDVLNPDDLVAGQRQAVGLDVPRQLDGRGR